MSKSLGNIIDPLDMIEKYGADAVRLSLVVGAAPGSDIKLSEDRIRGYKNFANKLWNISRFVFEQGQVDTEPEMEVVEEARGAAAEVTKHIESFRLDLAIDTAYQFVWHRFADKILEESKLILRSEDKGAAARAAALIKSLQIILKMLHPFMPFVTEEIWDSMPSKTDLLIVEEWPVI
jgi:valyl-tRNA synthetase